MNPSRIQDHLLRVPKRPLIIVIGSINMDLVTRIDRLPTPGETIRGGDLLTVPGGKGANQAVAAARLGARVYMVGAVGDDVFGTQLLAGLQAAGVDTMCIRRIANTSSGTATILLQPGGENSIVISPGANAHVTPTDVDWAQGLLAQADALLLQLEIPQETVRYAARLAKTLDIPVILDPTPVPSERLSDELMQVHVLSPNQTEGAALLGLDSRTSAQHVAEKLVDAGARHAVLKLGSEGSLHLASHASPTAVKSFRVDVVDTTAAGDTFTAALAVAMAEGNPWPDALRFANAAGALACTVLGAQPSIPTRDRVDALLTHPSSLVRHP